MSIAAIERLKQKLNQQELKAYEVIPLLRPLSFENYQNWLNEKQHGKMNYMAKNADVREEPADHFKPMQSMIVFTQSYFPWQGHTAPLFKNLKVAHYACDQDYHLWFRKKLNGVIQNLKQEFPEEDFLAFTDAVPLLERDHGVQAGLGWVGKNTCLIHPKRGSLFFIGEILTTLCCDQSFLPMHDFCGSCTACMDECPTDALATPRVLDANKCLAYWNIESRDVPPVEIREKMQGWLFGCDICQTVCPWNIKLHKDQPHFVQKIGDTEKATQDLKIILESSNKKLLKRVKETPLSRAGGRGLKRNALIVIANLKLKALKPQVESFLDHESLGELAQWTLKQLETS